MVSLIRLFSIVCVTFITALNAYAKTLQFEPGVYETLLLAVDKNGAVTGYYYEELGQSRCRFFVKGNAKQGLAKLVAWEHEPISGELKAGADEVILTVKGARDFSGCGMVMMPEIDTGVSYSLVAKAPWSELRSIASAKAYFYSEAKADKQLKSYLVKGDVVGVVASQGEWLQIDYRSPSNGKISRRWIYSRDADTFRSTY